MRLRMHLHLPAKRSQSGFSAIEALLIILVVAAMAVIGFVVYQHHRPNSAKNSAATNLTHTTSPTQSTVAQSAPTDPYEGWKLYTSSEEKASFKYPSNWTTVDTSGKIGATGDSLQLKSPSGALTLSWFSAVSGLGGACDATIMPGTAVGTGALGPCPYWYVLDKQKLTGADLYYVAGIETNDDSTYAPWCALQSSNGILNNEGSIGYQLFQGKNNDFKENGHDLGLQQAGLKCGTSFGDFAHQGLPTGTKAQATALLSTSEYQQAKLILLSFSYPN